MSEQDDDELERIREQKRERLQKEAGGGAIDGSDDSPASNETPAKPIEITDRDHFQTVLDEHEVVLVDCYADWCGPCKMMEPVIEDLAATSDAAVAKLDVDAHQQIAAQLGAQSIPTLLVFVGGEPTQRLVGAQNKAALEQALTQARA